MLRYNVHVYSHGVLGIVDVNMSNLVSLYMGTSKREHVFDRYIIGRFKETFELLNQFYMYFKNSCFIYINKMV